MQYYLNESYNSSRWKRASTEETIVKPKPMVMVGDKLIISHIIEIYTKYGFNDFLIAAGYKTK